MPSPSAGGGDTAGEAHCGGSVGGVGQGEAQKHPHPPVRCPYAPLPLCTPAGGATCCLNTPTTSTPTTATATAIPTPHCMLHCNTPHIDSCTTATPVLRHTCHHNTPALTHPWPQPLCLNMHCLNSCCHHTHCCNTCASTPMHINTCHRHACHEWHATKAPCACKGRACGVGQNAHRGATHEWKRQGCKRVAVGKG